MTRDEPSKLERQFRAILARVLLKHGRRWTKECRLELADALESAGYRHIEPTELMGTHIVSLAPKPTPKHRGKPSALDT